MPDTESSAATKSQSAHNGKPMGWREFAKGPFSLSTNLTLV